jgi:hypothetical protein
MYSEVYKNRAAGKGRQSQHTFHYSLQTTAYRIICTATIHQAWGGVVVKALRYQSGGLRIDPQWSLGIFSRG